MARFTAAQLHRDGVPDPVVTIENVHMAYGPTSVLQGLSLQLRPGEVLGLVGANGAGKTTLLKLVAALGIPDSGRIIVAGYDTTSQAETARRQVGALFHQTHLYEDLTPEENLRFWSTMSGRLLDAEALRGIFARLGLASYRQQRVRSLSHGTKKRIALARLMLGPAPLLLLDEPYSGLDAPTTAVHDDFLCKHRGQGGSALLVSHHLAALYRVCDRLAVLADGRIVRTVATEEISLGQLQAVVGAADNRGIT